MMNEAAEIARIANPTETLLVADSLTGQDAVKTAKAFHERLPLTGLVLTRTDGDGRGGAALSMRHVTGLPIKFLGAGEKIDALEVFDAERVAGRILGQGDVVALVEKAVQEIDQADAEKAARKFAKGQFDLDDLANQLRQMKKMGGMQGILGMLPGVAKVKKQIAESGVDDRMFDRQVAIITSMTKIERKKPDILNGSRKRRIAAGSGVEVQDVNRLLKQHRQMADMVKSMSRGGGKGMAGMMAAMQGMGGGGMGGLPPGLTPPGSMGGGFGGRAPNLDQLKALGGGKLPGLGSEGGGLPNLGALSDLLKKK
jgi:signal recognition particle subunit SRP54